VEPRGELALGFDGADRWPRYFFDIDRARLECEAWLRKRRQWRGRDGETEANNREAE
jgi:hypothetical protein